MAIENEVTSMRGKRELSVSSGVVQVEMLLKQLEKMPGAITYKGFWELLGTQRSCLDSIREGKGVNDYRDIRQLEEDVYGLANIIIRMQTQLRSDIKEKEADKVDTKQRSDQASTISTGYSLSKLDDKVLHPSEEDKEYSEICKDIGCKHGDKADGCKREQNQEIGVGLDKSLCTRKPEGLGIDDMVIEMTTESKYDTIDVAKNLVKRKWTVVTNGCRDYWNKLLCRS